MDFVFRNYFKLDFIEVGYFRVFDFVLLTYGLVETFLALLGHVFGNFQFLHVLCNFF